MDYLPPNSQTEFEAQADRAREVAKNLVAASIAAEAAKGRRGATGGGLRGRGAAFLSRVRSKLGAIRGE